MKQHRILYMAPEIAIPGTHGGSSHVQGAIDSFLRLGHSVVVLSKWERHLPFYETKGKLTIIRKPLPKNSLLRNVGYILYGLFLSPIFMLLYGVDLVYERSRLFSGMAILYAKLFGKDSVYELNEPIETIGEGKRLLQYLAVAWGRFVAGRATLVTGTHPIFFKHLLKHNCLLIDYGANPSLFRPEVNTKAILKKYKLTKDKVVFYSGSFAPWHHIPAILQSAKEVVKKDKQITYFLVGKGRHYALAQKLIASLHLQNNVKLAGYVDYKHMPEYVNTATITLAIFDRTNPTIKKYDYFYSPIKLHEYKAAGKPIIASNLGNLRKYVIPGKNGYLVDQNNMTTELPNAILKLLHNKNLRQKMGKTNRQEVIKTYNWDQVNKTILRKLEQ